MKAGKGRNEVVSRLRREKKNTPLEERERESTNDSSSSTKGKVCKNLKKISKGE